MDLLIQAARAAEKQLNRALAQHGLTYPQFEVLRMVRDAAGSVKIGDTADSIGCTRGNLTGITDRLERDGWIERQRSTNDRRVVMVVLRKPEQLARVEAALAPLMGQVLPPQAEEYLGSVIVAAHG